MELVGVRQRVVVDAEPGPWYSAIGSFKDYGDRVEMTLRWSADGEHFSYTAFDGERWFAVVDGEDGQPFDAIAGPVILSPDGSRSAFFATAAGVRYAIIDGKRSEPFDESQRGATFTDDSRHFLFHALRDRTHYLFVDGVPVAERRQAPGSQFWAPRAGVLEVITLNEVEPAIVRTTIELP